LNIPPFFKAVLKRIPAGTCPVGTCTPRPKISISYAAHGTGGIGVGGTVSPTASAYKRKVSTLAMTILASIASSSIPTRETLAQMSMTMPLSRIRSITSARLDDWILFGTAILHLSFLFFEPGLPAVAFSPINGFIFHLVIVYGGGFKMCP